MSSSLQPAPSSPAGERAAAEHRVAWNEPEDVAFGCECANPALQIDAWGPESSVIAQPPGGVD